MQNKSKSSNKNKILIKYNYISLNLIKSLIKFGHLFASLKVITNHSYYSSGPKKDQALLLYEVDFKLNNSPFLLYKEVLNLTPSENLMYVILQYM